MLAVKFSGQSVWHAADWYAADGNRQGPDVGIEGFVQAESTRKEMEPHHH